MSVCRHRQASHGAQISAQWRLRKQYPGKRRRAACRSQLTWKGISADAIAPAMTSSALLSHHKAVGTLVQTPRALAGRNYPAYRSQPLGETNFGPNCQPPRSPLPLRFSGEETFPNAPDGVPGITTWNRRVLPSSCGCQEGNTTSCILLWYPANRKSNPAMHLLGL